MKLNAVLNPVTIRLLIIVLPWSAGRIPARMAMVTGFCATVGGVAGARMVT